jgi:transcriptional regulator with XRE-family HTH domain
MTGIKISPEKFKSLRAEKGISAYRLARVIGSNSVQMWRLDSGKHTTSTAFLQRLVPVFGTDAVAELIVDEGQREAFVNHMTLITQIQSAQEAA